MRAATRTVSAQSAGSYRTGCASSVRRRRFVDRNRANGFRSGCPAARLRGPSRGAWKIFRKKDRLYSVAFFADRMRKRNPYPVFPSIVSLRSTFSLHSVPGSAAVCGTGSVRTRYFCYICSRRCRRYRAPSYRIIFNNIRSMKISYAWRLYALQPRGYLRDATTMRRQQRRSRSCSTNPRSRSKWATGSS